MEISPPQLAVLGKARGPCERENMKERDCEGIIFRVMVISWDCAYHHIVPTMMATFRGLFVHT